MNDQERNEEEQRENESDNQMTLSANKLNGVDGNVVVLPFSNQSPHIPELSCTISVYHNGVMKGTFEGGSFFDIGNTGRYSLIKLDSNNLEFKINPFKAEADVGEWTIQYGWHRFPPVILSEYELRPFAMLYSALVGLPLVAATGLGAYCLVGKWPPKIVVPTIAAVTVLGCVGCSFGTLWPLHSDSLVTQQQPTTKHGEQDEPGRSEVKSKPLIPGDRRL